MKFMTTWAVRPEKIKEATARFLATGGPPPEGVKSLQRWHKADLSGGFHLVESDDPAAMIAASAEWADVLELQSTVVVDDAVAGAALKNAPFAK